MTVRRGKIKQREVSYEVVDRIPSGRLVGLEVGDIVKAEALGMPMCQVKVEQIRVDKESGTVTEINVVIYATKTGRPYPAKAGRRRVLQEEQIVEIVDVVKRTRSGKVAS